MKLSIVIVNWNTRDLLRQFLESIAKYSPSFDYEVFVVDNASHDHTVSMIVSDFPGVKLIANGSNRGFAAANNQAIKLCRGEYVLCLNPDTKVLSGALETIVRWADQKHEAGIVGGQILNFDGTVQGSIRKFPNFWEQFFVNKILRRDPEKNFDYSREQKVDQVMGAFMLLRREMLNEIGLWDEGYYIWMEDVDICKRAQLAGWQVYYLPTAQVAHSRGASFNQHSQIWRQYNFNKSCIRYYHTYHNWFITSVLRVVNSFSLALAGVRQVSHIIKREERQLDSSDRLKLSQVYFWLTLFFVSLAELLSFLGHWVGLASSLGWLIVFGATLLLAWRRLEYGIMIAIVELIIGSQGHLFELHLGAVGLSVRMGIFIALLGVWLARVVPKIWHTKSWRVLAIARSHFLHWYVFLGFTTLISLIIGLWQWPLSLVYSDFNAWLFFLFALPVSEAIISKGSLSRLLSVAVAGLVSQVALAMLSLYVMTHSAFGHNFLYAWFRWIRETGVGEITQLTPWFPRVFFQSQAYLAFGLVAIVTLLGVLAWRSQRYAVLWRRLRSSQLWVLLVMVGIMASLLISFSRSLWMATAVALVVWFGWYIWTVKSWRFASYVLSVLAISGLLSVMLVALVAVWPIPRSSGALSIDLLTMRTTNDAAAATRWSSWPVLTQAISQSPWLGYGFGKTLTYESYDPRVVEITKDGLYTTYAFEWGYLDILLKSGLIGLVAYILLLGFILAYAHKVSRSLRLGTSDIISIALVIGGGFGIVVLGATHFFTPYLNHPIGISYIVVYATVLELLGREKVVN